MMLFLFIKKDALCLKELSTNIEYINLHLIITYPKIRITEFLRFTKSSIGDDFLNTTCVLYMNARVAPRIFRFGETSLFWLALP